MSTTTTTQKLVMRSDRIAYAGVGTNPTSYTRMKGFTTLSTSKNPTEYTRKYVDENQERNDVTGYATAIDFEFDLHSNNTVHADISSRIDDEKRGDDMAITIINVDYSTAGTTTGTFSAVKRDYSIIPDGDGDGTDAYTYSGSFVAKGEIVKGDATPDDDKGTVTFAVPTDG